MKKYQIKWEYYILHPSSNLLYYITTEEATSSVISYAKVGSDLSSGDSWTTISTDISGEVIFPEKGTYYVVCNAYNNSYSCTGNPGCPWGDDSQPGFSCDGWRDCGNNDYLTVAVINPVAWFQTQGGNVYGRSVASSIPSLLAPENRYFSLSSSWADSGLVSSSAKEPEPADFNGAGVSQTDSSWQAKGNLSALANRYTYQYFASLLDVNEANEAVDFQTEGGDLTNPVLSEKDIIAYSGDNMVVNSPWDIADNKIIAFVDGDLTINEPISVGDDGFLALIVNGDLAIYSGVAVEANTSLLQGVYIVDGTITTAETVDAPKFIGEGIFFARSGFLLNRDLGSDNASYPAETFIFQPQYLFTAPKIFRQSPKFWQEVAP